MITCRKNNVISRQSHCSQLILGHDFSGLLLYQDVIDVIDSMIVYKIVLINDERLSLANYTRIRII